MSGNDEGELIRRATAAWFRRCRREGHVVRQPSAGMSEYRDGVVTLRNVVGTLAVYAVERRGRLVRLPPNVF